MIINKTIKATFEEISKEAVRFANQANPNYDLLRRLIKIYNKDLTDEERIFILYYVLEMIHYKNIIIDPETVLTMTNIRLRYYFMTMGLTFVLIGVSLIGLFKFDLLQDSIEGVLEFFKFLGAI